MGGCRAGLRERRFVGRASPPPLPPPTPPSPLLPRYLRSGVPSAFAGGIGPQSAANTLQFSRVQPRQRDSSRGRSNINNCTP